MQQAASVGAPKDFTDTGHFEWITGLGTGQIKLLVIFQAWLPG